VGVRLIDCKCENVAFINCHLADVTFVNVDLADVRFYDVDLRSVRVLNIEMREAIWTTVCIEHFVMDQSTLRACGEGHIRAAIHGSIVDLQDMYSQPAAYKRGRQ